MDTDLKEVKLRFFGMAIADILRSMRGRSLMGAFTLTMCAIDALAYLRGALPSKRNRENFENWVTDWMVPLNSRCRPDVLYALRCGLVHTYGYAEAMQRCGLVGFEYVHDRPAEHWDQPMRGYWRLNLDSLVAELCVAAFRFFDGVSRQAEQDPAFAEALKGRAQRLLTVQVSQIVPLEPPGRQAILRSQPVFYRFGEMDSALAPLDQVNEPSVAEIGAQIRSIY